MSTATAGLNWNFSIGDRLSGPAKGMSTALDKFLGKVKANDKAIKSMDAAVVKLGQRQVSLGEAASKAKLKLMDEQQQVDRVTASLKKMEAASRGAQKASAKLGWGARLRGAMPSMPGLPGMPGLGAIGGIVGAGFLAKQGFDAGLNLLTKGIGEASFKRNALSQMELLGDSKQQANTNYDWMMRMADATPFDDRTVVGAVNRFRSAGFGLGETQSLMLGISDAAGTSAENAAEMVNQFLQIKSVGKVTLDNLNTFLERTGGVLGRDDIFGGVAKRRGVALSQIDRENVSFDEFANAFMDAVQQKLNRGGPVGTRSVKLGRETIEGQWNALKDNYNRLFRDIGVDPVVNMLDRLNKELSGAFGEEMKGGINKLFSDTFDSLFGKYQGAGSFDRLKDDLRVIGERAITFATALEKIVIAAAKAADFAVGTADWLGRSALADVIGGNERERVLGAHAIGHDLVSTPGLGWIAEKMLSPETMGYLESRPSTVARRLAAKKSALDSIDFDFSGIPDPPKMATGGIVRRPTYALIGEAGPEAVVPLSGGRGMGSPQITIVQHIAPGGGELARQVADETRRALTEALEALALRAGVA